MLEVQPDDDEALKEAVFKNLDSKGKIIVRTDEEKGGLTVTH